MSSRITLAPAVLFLTAMGGLYLLTHCDRSRRLAYLLVIALPVWVGLAGMLYYNDIRYGSWSEFGLRYSITGLNYHKLYSEAFSLANFLPNLNNYLINPFKTLSIFPYVEPDLGGRLLFFRFNGPQHYFSEDVSGLIPTFPYFAVSLIPLGYLLQAGWKRATLRSESRAKPWLLAGIGLRDWLLPTLGGASILAFVPILLFITCNMRYLADVTPMLVLLSSMGFWLGAESLRARPVLRWLFIASVIALIVYSAGVSLLLAITGDQSRLEHLNPLLFEQLTRWLTP
jgi:hypothetical protein